MTKPKRILNKTQKLIIDTAVDSACHARQSIIFIMVEYLRGKKVSKKMDINHDAYLSKYMELEEYPDPKGDAMVNLIKKVSIAAESKGALIELIRQVITVCINMELLDLIQDVNAVTDSVVETLDTELNELVNSTVSGLIEIIKPLYLETTGEKKMELSKSKKNDFYINMISRVVKALKDNEDPLISSCYKDLQERNIDMESLLVAAFYIESERNISRSLNDKQEELYLYLEQGVHNCLHNIVCSGILTNKKSARAISISIRNLLHLLTKRFKREMISVALITDTLVENEEDYGMICRNNYAWLVDEAMELVKNNPDPIIVNRLNALNKRLGDIGKYQLEVFIANANKDKSKVNYSREDLSPSLLASLTASWLEFGVDDPEVTNKIPTDELEIECRLWSIFTEKTFFIYIDEANRKNGEKK